MTPRRSRIVMVCQCRLRTGLLVLLACGVIRAGALNRNPGSHAVLQQVSYRGGDGATGHANNRHRRHHTRGRNHRGASFDDTYRKGTVSGVVEVTDKKDEEVDPSADGEGADYPEAIEVSGADLVGATVHLNGVYLREWNVNGAPHFKRRSKRGSRTTPVHLFFSGSEWMLHLDVDTDLDVQQCFAYSDVIEPDPLRTSRRWAVRVGQTWVRRPHMRLARTAPDLDVGRPGRTAHESRGVPPSRVPRRSSPPVGEATVDPKRSSTQDPSVLAATDSDMAASDAALSRCLTPLFLVFVLDAVGLGVALPVLPFYVMGLKATALQLAVVVSSNFIAQTFGCIITGNMSDAVGRKPVVICCLLGTIVSHMMVARSTTLGGVALGRIIGGVTGGMTPIAQAAVADVVPLQSVPKFMGRIQACVGLGFVLGPATMTVLQKVFRVSTADTFFAAAIFPLVGVVYAIFWMSETKPGDSGISQLWRGSVQAQLAPKSSASSKSRSSFAPTPPREIQVPGWREPRDSKLLEDDEAEAFDAEDTLAWEDVDEAFDAAGSSSVDDPALTSDGPGGAEQLIPRAVLLLVGNGFLLMYAFSIETIYAMFLKDNFGYGESVLSMVFALNGLAVGVLQLFGMRHLVRVLGKHVMLILGNVLLALGMIGMALLRQPVLHFMLFTVHIMGYSLADTALVALISRYASPETQGRSMGLNQAAQSLSRVISPVVAGLLYEWSKQRNSLPLGALPYLVGSVFPLLGVAVPFWLYLRSVDSKKRRGIYARGGWFGDIPEGCDRGEEISAAAYTFEHKKAL